MDDDLYYNAMAGNQTLQAQSMSILNRSNSSQQSQRECIQDERYPKDVVSMIQNTPQEQLGRVRNHIPTSQVQQYNLPTYLSPNQYQVDPREKQAHVRDIRWLDNRTYIDHNLVDPGRITQYNDNSPLSPIDTLGQVYPTRRREKKDDLNPQRQTYDQNTRSYNYHDSDIYLQGYPVSSRNINLPERTLL